MIKISINKIYKLLKIIAAHHKSFVAFTIKIEYVKVFDFHKYLSYILIFTMSKPEKAND